MRRGAHEFTSEPIETFKACRRLNSLFAETVSNRLLPRTEIEKGRCNLGRASHLALSNVCRSRPTRTARSANETFNAVSRGERDNGRSQSAAAFAYALNVDLYGRGETAETARERTAVISGNASLTISIAGASSFPGGGARRRDAAPPLKANFARRFSPCLDRLE